MRKLLALLALLALAAAPAAACDYPAPVALGVAPHCNCPDPAALGYSASVQSYSAPVVQLAPVVQSYQSATVALPTVTHSYSASGFGAGSGYNAFGSGHNAFSLNQLRAYRHAEHAFAQARFGGNAFGFSHNVAFARRNAFVARGHDGNAFARNQAFNRGFVAGRRNAFGRRREGIVTRALRAPGRILGGLFGR